MAYTHNIMQYHGESDTRIYGNLQPNAGQQFINQGFENDNDDASENVSVFPYTSTHTHILIHTHTYTYSHTYTYHTPRI